MIQKRKIDLTELASQLATIPEDVVGLRGVAAFVDEVREYQAAIDRQAKLVDLRGVTFCAAPTEMLNAGIRNFRVPRPTCDGCCHFQAHPPRCQLLKRSISPKQFICKKYSPKYSTLSVKCHHLSQDNLMAFFVGSAPLLTL